LQRIGGSSPSDAERPGDDLVARVADFLPDAVDPADHRVHRHPQVHQARREEQVHHAERGDADRDELARLRLVHDAELVRVRRRGSQLRSQPS
jgi:hypothetical protein